MSISLFLLGRPVQEKIIASCFDNPSTSPKRGGKIFTRRKADDDILSGISDS